MWQCSGKGERLGQGRSGFDPGLRSSFFLIETLSITGEKFSKCLKNGSERLRKGKLRRWSELRENARAGGKVSRGSGVSFHVSLARDFLLAGCFLKALCISLLVCDKYADTSLCSSVVRSGRET